MTLQMSQKDYLIKVLKEEYEHQQKENGKTSFVIGLSGGTESSVVAALAVAAVGKENVVLVNMPYGRDDEMPDADTVATFLKTKLLVIPITTQVNDIIANYYYAIKAQRPNMPERNFLIKHIRRSILFYVASQNNGVVLNCISKTKAIFGGLQDEVTSGDCLFPILDYLHNEVINLGLELGLPEHILFKNDNSMSAFEREIDATYSQIDDFLTETPSEISEDFKQRMKEKYNTAKKKTIFKPQYPVNQSIEIF